MTTPRSSPFRPADDALIQAAAEDVFDPLAITLVTSLLAQQGYHELAHRILHGIETGQFSYTLTFGIVTPATPYVPPTVLG